MVTDYLQVHQAYLKQMVAASGPRLKDPVPVADQPGDDCSNEECSNEDEVPHPLAEQVTANHYIQQHLLVPVFLPPPPPSVPNIYAQSPHSRPWPSSK